MLPPKPLSVAPRIRFGGVRTAKTVFAAVVAFLLAPLVSQDPAPILAPLTALLVVQVTLYESLTSGLQRVASVVLGVLVAVVLARTVSLTWWSLGVVVAVGIVLGIVLRLGDHRLEVPISAMLILAVGGSRGPAYQRVWETLLGAAVGVLVHLVVAPPLYVRPAGDAVQQVADGMGQLLDDASLEIARGYGLAEAERWLDRARQHDRGIAGADRALVRSEASLRLNPRALNERGRRLRSSPVSLRTGLDGLERASVSLRGAFRALADRARGPNEETVYGGDVREVLAQLLTELARAVRAYGRVVNDEVTSTVADDRELRTALNGAWAARNELGQRLHTGGRAASSAWELHGDLLANIDRLLREVDAEGRAQLRSSLSERVPRSRLRPAVARVRDRRRGPSRPR